MESFDILNAPVKGTYLIEASAGTGKTYTLEGLVVRLIITHHLPIERILAVTFTNNAAEELKDRIRKKLLSVRQHLKGDFSDDDFINNLSKEIKHPTSALEKINHALVDFDKAAIYTIHGFCQRILAEQAFETNAVFATDIVPDPSGFINEIANDYWRNKIYCLPTEIMNYVIHKISGPEYFAHLYRTYFHPDARILPQNIHLQTPNPEAFRACIKKAHTYWDADKKQIVEILKDPALDGRKYGSATSTDQQLQLTKREKKLHRLANEMVTLFSSTQTGFPLFPNFELFSQTKITSSTGKNKVSPAHPFFALCDELIRISNRLEEDAEKFVLALEVEFLDYAQTQLKIKKQENHFTDFDDLLIMVRNALRGIAGYKLTQTLQDKYKAVLVDEFQDTDSIQYDIFSTVFSTAEHALYFIGDPKQAIYGFRGADIFSYMKAVDQTKASFTLQKNWRSTPDLIQAINTLFSTQNHPFLFEKIPFKSVISGRNNLSEQHHLGPAVSLWHLFSKEDPDNQKPISVEQAADIILNFLPNEIIKLSHPPYDIPFKDMAVLVRTNRQAAHVMQHLRAKNIPSVVYYSGNVFETAEASELQRILWGLADPGNARKLKAALATQLLDAQGNDFDDSDADMYWERRVSRMQRYAMLWKKHGFMRMFKVMLSEEKIKQRIVAVSDGERRLTDLLHLGELLHQEDMEKRPGIQGLIKWFGERREKKAIESEDHLLRLEKDTHAVKIITIHKSKGLEYPVVFCPFGWEGSQVPEKHAVRFHDPHLNNTLITDLGSEQLPHHKILAEQENLAENIRLYYVALTRAKQKCYMAWGRIRNAETSAPAYLFHFSKDLETTESSDVVTRLKNVINARNDGMLLKDLNHLAKRSKNTIELVSLMDATEKFELKSVKPGSQYRRREFSGRIDNSWKITSYSNLTSSHDSATETADRDRASLFAFPEIIETDKYKDESQTFSDVLYFPKGAHAGLFFHDLLEHIDFADEDALQIKDTAGQKLDAYGIPREWDTAVAKMIKNITTTPLPSLPANVSLSEISTNNRINEMEFYYPIQNASQHAFKKFAYQEASIDISETVMEERFGYFPVKGFMRGFIDLVFRYKNKYYLLDWKSNYLGPNFEDYTLGNIQHAMMDHKYHIQYMIYIIALNQYLSQKLANYDYESHFGGVFYLFIRGIRPELGADHGMFYDRPAFSYIEKLTEQLIKK